jgi:hypothetical protein
VGGRRGGQLLTRARSPAAAEDLAGALTAATLAEIPLLDLLTPELQAAAGDPDSETWTELNTLTRVEVS